MSELADDAPLAEAEQDAATWRILVRSFWTLVVGEGTARIFGLATILLLARNLGPGGFGLAVVGMALVDRFTLISDSGTELLTVRNVAREPERFRELTEKILGLRLALALVAVVLYEAAIAIFAALNHTSGTDRTVYLTFGLALPAVALNLRWMVLGVRGERAVAVGNIAARLVFLIGVVALVVPSENVLRVPYAYAGGELAYALVVAGAVAPRYGLLRPRIDLAYWAATLRESVPLMISAFARGLTAFDLFLIAAVLGKGHAGIYGAASKPVMFVATAVGLFYISFISSYNATSGPGALALFRRSTRSSLALTILCAGGLSIAAGAFVPLLFGGRYSSAGPLLAILAWRLPFSAVGGQYNALLLSDGRQLLIMWNSIAVAVFNVVGDVVGLVLFGVRGIAAVTVLAAALILVLNHRSAVSLGLGPDLRSVLRPGRAEPRPAQ
jgi:O-antigen/teichoic acid export membrane protein